MSANFSNQATPKYLGYVYQVLIAIEQCFQAKPNEIIWIECRGDVYDGNTGTEVKHHFGQTNLTSNSPDFWTTLKNLVTEDISEFNSLVLHTTANIPSDSIFYGWNELPKTQKYKKLQDHSPVPTIKEDYDKVITNFPKKDLLPILEKLSIKSSQLNIKDKWEDLKNASIFTMIGDNHRDDAFHWVYGYVNKLAINDRYNWHIKKNDFDNACRYALPKWIQGNIPFEIINKAEVDCSERGYIFVNELQEIKLRENTIERAIADYLRAQQNRIRLLKMAPATMPEVLDNYDQTVLEVLESLKDQYSYNTDASDIGTDQSFKAARDLYHNSIKQSLINIPEVDNTQKYYQDGRMHHNVNEGRFIWRFCKDDFL